MREMGGAAKSRDYIHVESSQYSDLMGTHDICLWKRGWKKRTRFDLDVEGYYVDIHLSQNGTK